MEIRQTFCRESLSRDAEINHSNSDHINTRATKISDRMGGGSVSAEVRPVQRCVTGSPSVEGEGNGPSVRGSESFTLDL
jgi:S-adenosylmethionine synthetase